MSNGSWRAPARPTGMPHRARWPRRARPTRRREGAARGGPAHDSPRSRRARVCPLCGGRSRGCPCHQPTNRPIAGSVPAPVGAERTPRGQLRQTLRAGASMSRRLELSVRGARTCRIVVLHSTQFYGPMSDGVLTAALAVAAASLRMVFVPSVVIGQAARSKGWLEMRQGAANCFTLVNNRRDRPCGTPRRRRQPVWCSGFAAARAPRGRS